MKRLIKILSVLSLMTVTTINVSACEDFNFQPNTDFQQQVKDAAKLIAQQHNLTFNTFLTNKNQTKINDFNQLIKTNIVNLFHNCVHDYSSISFAITNLDTVIKPKCNININLCVKDNNTIIAQENTAFTANFISLQTYIDEKMKLLTKKNDKDKDKTVLTLDKNDPDHFLALLKTSGAKFTQEEQYFTTNTIVDKDHNGAKFWVEWQKTFTQKANTIFLNVANPILTWIGETPITNLNFDSFKPLLATTKTKSNIIAITGHKYFKVKNANGYYDYLKIDVKGVNTINNNYKGITFIIK